jgi:hypothetical protein
MSQHETEVLEALAADLPNAHVRSRLHISARPILDVGSSARLRGTWCDRTFIPRPVLHRHAVEPMVHLGYDRAPTMRGRWITARRPA